MPMTETKIVKACLILIGNELLSGRTQDKNLAFITRLIPKRNSIETSKYRQP